MPRGDGPVRTKSAFEKYWRELPPAEKEVRFQFPTGPVDLTFYSVWYHRHRSQLWYVTPSSHVIGSLTYCNPAHPLSYRKPSLEAPVGDSTAAGSPGAKPPYCTTILYFFYIAMNELRLPRIPLESTEINIYRISDGVRARNKSVQVNNGLP